MSAVQRNREALIIVALTDAVAAPQPPLPRVAETDAVAAFDRWLAYAPRANRDALRLALRMLDLAPRALGYGDRLHSLPRSERARALEALKRIPLVRRVAEALCAAASISYFGDDGVLRMLGYDAQERVARGRELRRIELRP